MEAIRLMTTKELGKCEALLNGAACSALYRAALDAEETGKLNFPMVFGPRSASVCYTKVSEGKMDLYCASFILQCASQTTLGFNAMIEI